MLFFVLKCGEGSACFPLPYKIVNVLGINPGLTVRGLNPCDRLFRDSFGILIAPTSWVCIKAGFCIRSNNRRFSAWSRFRTGLSCSSDRRFHQISLPSRCSACKLLNRLYFLCGLIVFIVIFFLLSHKKWEPFFFQAPTKILCCCPHHIPLCSPLKFIFLLIFRA